MPPGEEKKSTGWRNIELPEDIVDEAEDLMKARHEGRLAKVPLGLFIGDLIKESIEREEVQRKYSPFLEEYSIEPDCVYIRDNQRDVVAELRFKDAADLYCNIDGAKNCVHIGFALSIPKVTLLIQARRTKDPKEEARSK